jgi:7-carboxy-7-deazaguanine synthase
MVVSAPALVRTKTWPVIEIFGPTIQGEGAEAGLPTHFVRLGGCDFRCSWCDTMYAVDPATVRSRAERLSSHEIVRRLGDLAGAPEWVTISGGNPALHRIDELVAGLQDRSYRVATETQGSVWRDWLGVVDRLTVSPKPPSSGMATERHERQLRAFMSAALDTPAAANVVLKIVCFDEDDICWAKRTAHTWAQLPLFLSAGTSVPALRPLREDVGERYRWLCERVAFDPDLANVRVLPQLHVIAWEGATGV